VCVFVCERERVCEKEMTRDTYVRVSVCERNKRQHDDSGHE